MSLSKAHLYDEADQMVSFYAGGLNYPGRLRIIRTLRDQGPKTVFDLAIEHPLSLSAISQHLNILSKKGLVAYEPRFPYLFYSLNREQYEEAKKCLLDFFE
jgi:DNA-binding transcriptional ArsR family regulator